MSGILKIVVVAIISLFVVGLSSIFMYLITESFFTEFNGTGLNTTETGQVENSAISTLQFLDWVIVLLLGITVLGTIYMGYQATEPPIFFVVTFLGSMFVGAIGFILDYIFKEIIIQTQFSSIITYFPNTIIICTNLHWIALICIVGSGIVAYTQRGGGTPEI